MPEHVLTFILGMAGYAIYKDFGWNSTLFMLWVIATIVWLLRDSGAVA